MRDHDEHGGAMTESTGRYRPPVSQDLIADRDVLNGFDADVREDLLTSSEAAGDELHTRPVRGVLGRPGPPGQPAVVGDRKGILTHPGDVLEPVLDADHPVQGGLCSLCTCRWVNATSGSFRLLVLAQIPASRRSAVIDAEHPGQDHRDTTQPGRCPIELTAPGEAGFRLHTLVRLPVRRAKPSACVHTCFHVSAAR